MPELEVKTVSATQVWVSPDGNRKIYELQLEWEGKPVKAKTYSDAIATPGWTGKVESYEKAGRNGSETFVKQPPKEGGGYGGGYKGGGKQSDSYAMYLSYAKDIAVALIASDIKPSTKAFDSEYVAALGAVEAGGAQLFSSKDALTKQSEGVPNTTLTKTEPETVSLEDLSDVLGDVTNEEGETPWGRTTS